MDENLIMIIVWVTIFLITLIAEISTEALVSIWFTIGAIFAAALTYVPGMPWWGEIIVFAIISLLSFLIIKPLVNKKLQRIKSNTNVDSLLGKKGMVVKKITNLDKGEVKINSVIWNAIKRDSEEDIEKGEVVEIVAIQGNKLLVRKSSKEEN